MDKSKILSQLFNKGFELIQLKDFDSTEFTLFRKKQINIIVCHYLNELDIKQIEEDAKNLRSIMHINKINVWNTYLLISFDRDIDYQDLFQIERSSKSMRRYVITNEFDFNRIPFLDNIEVVSNPFKISSQTIVGNDEQVKKIIEFFDQNNGGNVKLKSLTIQNNLGELFDLEG